MLLDLLNNIVSLVRSVFVLFVLVFRLLWQSGGVLFVTAERWRPKHTTKQIVVNAKARPSVLTALFISWFIDCVVLLSSVFYKKINLQWWNKKKRTTQQGQRFAAGTATRMAPQDRWFLILLRDLQPKRAVPLSLFHFLVCWLPYERAIYMLLLSFLSQRANEFFLFASLIYKGLFKVPAIPGQ